MQRYLAPPFQIAFALLFLAALPWAQVGHGVGSKPDAAPSGSVRFLIPGTVKDLTRDSAGRLLYCTAEREVGRLDIGLGTRTVLATSGSGPFPNELRALAEAPNGDIAVLDFDGNVRVLHGGMTPAVLTYSDLYMIADATDLIIDARGSYLITSATPSPGQRAINWVQNDGAKWGYYLVRHQPTQLAADPLSGGVFVADATSGGNLQRVEPTAYRRTTAMDATTHPGISTIQDDGDMAFEAYGNLYWIAGGKVYKRQHILQTTSLFASGFGQLRGIAIARSSLVVGGWSLYLAEGSNPTRIREIPGVGQPASVIAPDQGLVPGRGIRVNVTLGFQAYELTVDNSNRLLLGGSLWGSTHYIKRVTLTGTPAITTVASSANGLSGIVEGLVVQPDNSILALTRDGTIQRVTEGPLAITTLFSDPANQITAGKDMVMDVNGALYVATREFWGGGKVLRVSGGAATLLTNTAETRGLAANPMGGMFLSQWHNSGFQGTVDLLHFAGNTLEAQPGFATMNYTNDFVWGDGDLCVDANGAIYSISEDDWSLVRYDPAADAFVRFGSGYTNHPSGLVIAPSTAGSGSATGWSLYVSEFDNVWEKPSVPPPVSTLVNSSLGLQVDRQLAGAPHPRYGKPRVIAAAPHRAGALIGTAEGWVLAFDPSTGAVEPLVGPEQGLRGELVALVSAPDSQRIFAMNAQAEVFAISARGVQRLTPDPRLLAPVLERVLAAPQRTLRWTDPLTRGAETFALDGWVVWRVGDAR